MESSKLTSRYTGAIFAVILLGGIVAVVAIGELPRLLVHEPDAPVAPAAIARPEASAPSAPSAVSAPAVAESDLRTRLNAELPRAGLPATARILETRGNGDRLTLIFDAALRDSLNDVSALDGWIGALSRRAADLGYPHLDLRIRLRDGQGRADDVTIDSLVRTPPEKLPRPEPIDDGVRR